MVFTATYYLAKASTACKVAFIFTENELIIQSIDGQPTDITYRKNQINVAEKIGSLPRELQLNDGSMLVLAHDAPIDDFLDKSTRGELLVWLEKNKLAWLLSAVLVPLSLYWLIATAIPAAAKSIAPALPHAYARLIDEQFLNTFDYLLLEESTLTNEKKAQLTKQWQLLEKKLALPVDKYQLFLRHSKKLGANAFALPGGTIVITDDLVTLLDKQPDAITAILLHEIGHVEHHHSMQMIAETTGTTLLMTYFLGDFEGVAEIFSGGVLTLIQNNFSRELEREADEFALEKLSSIGISPQAFADALTALSEGETSSMMLEEYLSSHPLIKERIKQASDAIKANKS